MSHEDEMPESDRKSGDRHVLCAPFALHLHFICCCSLSLFEFV
jgi:hypothetical protein